MENLSSPLQEKSPAERFVWLERGFFISLLIFVAVTRLSDLGAKPFHHDESLFALYAWQLADTGDYYAGGYDRSLTEEEQYKYVPAPGAPTHHPLLHGPFQMELIALIFRAARFLGLLGNGDATARLLSALSAIALFSLVWCMRRDLGREGRLLALLALSVSPGLWYYGRFCRNESPFLLATLVWTLALARAWRANAAAGPSKGRWIVALCLTGAALVAFKENSIFLLFNAVCFIILMLAHDLFGAANSPSNSLLFKRLARRHVWAWIGGLALAWLLLEAVYTNAFGWNTSFVSMYLDAMHYWSGQHKEHRLYGEYHYYLPMLALYEPAVLLVILGAAARFFISRRHAIAGALLLLAILAATDVGVMFGKSRPSPPEVVREETPTEKRFAVSDDLSGKAFAASTESDASSEQTTQSVGLLKLCHMTQAWHLGLAAGVGWATLCGAWHALRRRRQFRAYLIWWTGLSFLQYSYAGEKVPWVSVHIMLPAILLASEFAGDAWRRCQRPGRRPLIFMIALLTFWFAAWILNGLQGRRMCLERPSDPSELMIYNHTQPESADLAHAMRNVTLDSEGELQAMLQGEACWPLLWYLHDQPYHYSDGVTFPDLEKVAFVACDIDIADASAELQARFEFDKKPLRRAWIPESLHLFTPLDNALADCYPDGDVPAEEEWTDSDRDYIESKRSFYGFGAWRSLARYVVWRETWGDPEYTAVAEEVYFGTVKRAE